MCFNALIINYALRLLCIAHEYDRKMTKLCVIYLISIQHILLQARWNRMCCLYTCLFVYITCVRMLNVVACVACCGGAALMLLRLVALAVLVRLGSHANLQSIAALRTAHFTHKHVLYVHYMCRYVHGWMHKLGVVGCSYRQHSRHTWRTCTHKHIRKHSAAAVFARGQFVDPLANTRFMCKRHFLGPAIARVNECCT